jgi:Icc-related predicted phosphoesterase
VHTLWDYLDIPGGDTLLITGDITLTDKSADGFLTKFQTFLEKQKEIFKDIFVIAGNHDQIIQRLGKAEVQKRLEPSVYIENDLVVSSGGLTIFGSPWSAPEMKTHIGFQFFDPIEEKKFLQPLEHLEPGSIDILMTHGGGNHSSALTPIVQRLKPRVALSGHYHSEYGVQFVGETIFINCANVNVLYSPANPVVVFDIEPRQ